MGWLELERAEEQELIDGGNHPPELLAENLADMRRVNRWLGGVQLSVRALARLTRADPPGAELALLDVATGIGDIPHALAVWASRQGRPARIVATDISPAVLRTATGPHAPALAAADGLALPFPDRCFDVALCSFALHHLPPAPAARMLAEMGRVARRGVIINDLVRWRPYYLASLLLCRLASRNPLTRHDGPLSARRAYTRAEMLGLARRAGLEPLGFDSFLGYRVALTLRPA
ncbi:MAG TPA: methyltransferase domain-containing protein [Roseiflexaceae bacterium]|nr:methyltransferase domain-containing protein [Roseiflexaceae bacterium]